ncbi:hypothetical protein N7447_010544 [Penicillium robsamsonii]|uniref:uncharacterized protein n=1 Tax=Penicillium robsamsonii TaxID=1792511 RepID=UPI00254963A8|nr:uncharacterized protein N7447_010544 [Penicillium robsamsonii]KAJ5811028.1 hypothetical protein N7447_010544 [Penicillium robsamsonii]
MSQRGPSSMSNRSSFRFVASQTGNNGDKSEHKNNRTENAGDDIDKDLDGLSEQEVFQTGVNFVLSAHKFGDWNGHGYRVFQAHIPQAMPCQRKEHCYSLHPQPSTAIHDGRFRQKSFKGCARWRTSLARMGTLRPSRRGTG